jgi:heptosyltransferase-2
MLSIGLQTEKKEQIDFRGVKRIIIRSTNWVGDAVLTTPAVRAVRKNFPDAEITMLAKPWVAPIFYNNPHVDHVIYYEREGRHRRWSGKVRLVKALRKGKFDLAILFQNAFEAAILTYLAGVPNRLGYDTDNRRFLLTHSIKMTPRLKQIHEIDYYLGILQAVGLKVGGRALTLRVTDQERNRASEILKKQHVTTRDKLVGVSPGATYGSAKRWFPERYAALCDKIHESYGVRIIIFGGPGEEGTGCRVSESMRHPSVNLCGKTTLRETAALIERCRLFVTNDSGLMHIADALSVPLVAIFGSTNPITTGPSGPRSRVVRASVSCSPCLKPECPTDHKCMADISVDRVWAETDALLREDSNQ